MKIIKLEAENIKRIKAVEITPDGNLVQVTGRNGQGKTSVLDAIWWAMSGASNFQAVPIRKGEERGTIKLDLGELKILRTFILQDDGTVTTSLKVENGEGARFQSPQGMIDKMLGSLTFDPLAFTRLPADGQVKAMQSLASGFDFDGNAASFKTAFDARRDVNRDLKSTNAALDLVIKSIAGQDRPDRVDVAEIVDEIQQRETFNAERKERKEKRDISIERIAELKRNILELGDELKTREENRDSWKDLQDAKPIEGLKEKLTNSQTINDLASEFERRDEMVKKATGQTNAVKLCNDEMDDLREEASAAIATAELPIEGLTIEQGQVHLDDLPFDQASDAQQLQASIAIAMALNPTLKVIRVRDGSLLDDDAMAQLAAMADEHDYQIWVESVDSSGEIGFVMEDGALKVKAEVVEVEDDF